MKLSWGLTMMSPSTKELWMMSPSTKDCSGIPLEPLIILLVDVTV